MNEYAVTVIGHDRPGVIADVAEILARLGLNLTDSSMTRLRGHFAMTLVCAGPPAAAEIEAALAPLASRSLLVTVRGVAEEPEPVAAGSNYVLTVHGADRLGIVAALSRTVAEAGGNITDLTTRLAGELYVVVAELDVPGDPADLHAALQATAGELGVEVALRLADADLL